MEYSSNHCPIPFRPSGLCMPHFRKRFLTYYKEPIPCRCIITSDRLVACSPVLYWTLCFFFNSSTSLCFHFCTRMPAICCSNHKKSPYIVYSCDLPCPDLRSIKEEDISMLKYL